LSGLWPANLPAGALEILGDMLGSCSLHDGHSPPATGHGGLAQWLLVSDSRANSSSDSLRPFLLADRRNCSLFRRPHRRI
jgi:hypothetical protein